MPRMLCARAASMAVDPILASTVRRVPSGWTKVMRGMTPLRPAERQVAGVKVVICFVRVRHDAEPFCALAARILHRSIRDPVIGVTVSEDHIKRSALDL